MADRRPFVRGQRMPKHWHFIPGANLAFTGNATGVGGSLALDGPWTVIRMLGEYLIHFTGGSTIVIGDKATFALGIGVVSSDAVAAGAASLPDPAGEPEYPWLFWTSHELAAIEADALQRGGELGVIRRSFDIRSMRKLKPRESLVFVAQYVDVAGTPFIDVAIAQTRVLVAT